MATTDLPWMQALKDAVPPSLELHVELRSSSTFPPEPSDMAEAVLWISDSIGTPHATKSSSDPDAWGKARFIGYDVFDQTRSFSPFLIYAVLGGGRLHHLNMILEALPFRVKHVALGWFANELNYPPELKNLRETQRRLLQILPSVATSVKLVGPDDFWGYEGKQLEDFNKLVQDSDLLLQQPYTCRASEFQPLERRSWHIQAAYRKQLASIFAM